MRSIISDIIFHNVSSRLSLFSSERFFIMKTSTTSFKDIWFFIQISFLFLITVSISEPDDAM